MCERDKVMPASSVHMLVDLCALSISISTLGVCVRVCVLPVTGGGGMLLIWSPDM